MPKWGGSKAVVVKADAAEPSPARVALIDHLVTVAKIRTEHDAASEAIARLRQVIDQETAADAAFAELHRDHSSILGQWAEGGGTGPLPLPDAAQHARIEAALLQARRNAAAARSAITGKETIMTAVGARLAAAAQHTETLKLAVLIEQADAIGGRYLRTFREVVALVAQLRGLSVMLVQGQRRVIPPGRPEMIGIDLGMMSFGEVSAPAFAVGALLGALGDAPSWVDQAHQWRALFEALDADPQAEFPTEG